MFQEPADPITAQDSCFSEAGLDVVRWSRTVFLPLTLFGDGRSFALDDEQALTGHLRALESKAIQLGVTRLRTEIISHSMPVPNMAIVSTLRERLSNNGTVLGTVSMTWTVIRSEGSWKINQILFNDSVRDPSVTAQVFLGHPNKKEID